MILTSDEKCLLLCHTPMINSVQFQIKSFDEFSSKNDYSMVLNAKTRQNTRKRKETIGCVIILCTVSRDVFPSMHNYSAIHAGKYDYCIHCYFSVYWIKMIELQIQVQLLLFSDLLT